MAELTMSESVRKKIESAYIELTTNGDFNAAIGYLGELLDDKGDVVVTSDDAMLDRLYRWRTCYGGGIVIADSEEEAERKVNSYYCQKSLPYVAILLKPEDIEVWPWTNDDYFSEKHKDVLDIYGG